jgi:hypothetical protein
MVQSTIQPTRLPPVMADVEAPRVVVLALDGVSVRVEVGPGRSEPSAELPEAPAATLRTDLRTMAHVVAGALTPSKHRRRAA